ncbi:MAG: 3-phosphoglycerate dehydrogenase [Clostridiales bacterium]|jgi:D-3-phosphoglycerate dehydrogenase|nr:3-phosphoglycerate dehydrogenase [Clostridiales bacterium]
MAEYKILKLNEISDEINGVFDEKYSCTDDVSADADGIIVRSFKMADFETGSRLKAVARAGAGVNNIPVESMTEKNIVVFNTPGANANAVKELVICALLLASRKISEAVDWANAQKGKGGEVPKLVEKFKNQFVGPEISGKTLGIIGLGAIGILVANAAVGLNVKVLGYDPYLSVDAALTLSNKVERVKDINALYQRSDYITLHLPLLPATEGMINAETLAKMKDGVRIINCARGELVNSADIIAAARSKKVAKYVTDFPSDELLGVENIVAIPHLGASTPEAEDNCAVMAARQLKDYLENGNITNSVNYPTAVLARSGRFRLTVTHKNISSMIAQATAFLSESKINISNMISATRGNLGYMIIDTDGVIPQKTVDEMKKIDGFLQISVY